MHQPNQLAQLYGVDAAQTHGVQRADETHITTEVVPASHLHSLAVADEQAGTAEAARGAVAAAAVGLADAVCGGAAAAAAGAAILAAQLLLAAEVAGDACGGGSGRWGGSSRGAGRACSSQPCSEAL